MKELLMRYPALTACKAQIEEAVALLCETCHQGGKVLLCGNGGSSADCDHITGELMKSFLLPRSLTKEDETKIKDILGEGEEQFAKQLQYAIPAIALANQIALGTAFANDVSPEMVYAQLVFGYGAKHDLLFAFSTSGNSKNIVNACKAAKIKGMKIVGFTGSKACQLDTYCDIVIKAPDTETYKIQEYHLPIYHFICKEAEKTLFGGKIRSIV